MFSFLALDSGGFGYGQHGVSFRQVLPEAGIGEASSVRRAYEKI